ncbi:MAG: NAD(P)/FAD-dependent oxidoreductase [Lachnospiraceae bacterium]|nr:NAD(P)/FAD-dependent oxidoreductase [Lachnospiraceae bacterium]
MYDVIIIGAGVSGCAVARELARYKTRVLVLEKEEDVCCGTSKANSGIVHAGYDAKPGTLMAKLNVEGNAMIHKLCRELDFDFAPIGSLVVCLKEEDRPRLQELYDRGIKNGVPGLKIIERDRLLQLEPNIADNAVCALFAETAGVVCPFGLNIALAENAFTNGVEFEFNSEVRDIAFVDGKWQVTTDKEKYETKAVVNAAGVYADKFHNMVCDSIINITPRKGEYMLLDRTCGGYVRHTVFQLPDEMGKGVLVSPTAHGNLLVGPTAEDIEDKEGVNTTPFGLDKIASFSMKAVKNVPFRSVITSFAGLRAHEDGGEFIIGEAPGTDGFFDCAGIESPGLTSAPAIGRYLAEMIRDKYHFAVNQEFNGKRKGIIRPKNLSESELNMLLKDRPDYGEVICRCESITKGEIVDSIIRPLGAKSLDGVKRRTRAGMGRCQSGFCSPKTMEIISEMLGIPLSEVTKSGKGSKIIVGSNKDEI